MKITFLGDIMIEPPVLKAARRSGGRYDFNGVFAPSKALLSESDYVIGNLETPLAGKEAKYTETHLCFNAPDEYVDALKEVGVKVVSTANNHTFDRGYEGVERTVRVLDEKGLSHTGSYERGSERAPHYFTVGDTRFALIAYTYGTNYEGSGGNCLAEGEYADTVNLLCSQQANTYLSGVFRKTGKLNRFLRKVFKDDNVGGKICKALGQTVTYSRDDDCLENKTETPYIEQMKQDIRTAKQKADLVLFYPHVGGQFNLKPGAFTEYVVEEALQAGADAVVATHSHIPQRFVWKNGVPCSYCLGNFNMNPHSYLAMPEILTNYGYTLHLYVEDKRITRVTFSMMKNQKGKDGQIASVPVDELYAACKNDKQRTKLEKEIRHLYGRVTGRELKGNLVRREYDL